MEAEMPAAVATETETFALSEMLGVMRGARGDHPALANVRREAAAAIDALCATLAARGVDTDSLLDELDAVAS